MLTPLQSQVLKQVGRYRLSFAEATQRLLKLDSKEEAAEALTSLVASEFIEIRDGSAGLAEDCPYYVLTRVGVDHLGLPRDRVNFSGLSKHLSILWFCSMHDGTQERLLVDQKELKGIVDVPHHGVSHVLEKKAGRFIIYRIYVLKTPSRKQILDTCEGYLSKASPRQKLAIEQGDYGFALLCQFREPIRTLRKDLNNLPRNKVSFSKRARFIVELGASTETFPTVYAQSKAK